MIRHAPAFMATFTALFALSWRWAWATGEYGLSSLWLALTILGAVMTVILAAVTPGDSDE